MSRQHARIQKAVINLDHQGDRHIVCAWDDCDSDGYELHKAVVNYGTPGAPQIVSYVFCSDRHKMYWVHSHRSYGNLPPGYRMSVI